MKIAISGVGIGGPALAFWLRKAGHDVLLIEQSPKLRGGGYVVDFWGLGYDIVERMGILPRILQLGYRMKGMRYVNRNGGRTGGFSVEAFVRMTHDRFTEIQRADLSAALFAVLDDGVETLFGDSIATIDDNGTRVRLTFEHGSPREVDLVIGADGLHSRVRRLVFGPDSDFEKSLGYHVAACQLEGYRPRDELIAISHGIPGRMITRLSLPDDRTLILFVFRDEYLNGARPVTDQDRRSAVTSVFADAGWETSNILTAMQGAGELYFDSVSQIRMKHWTKGRTALIGDAGACVSLLAGEGTGLAIAEAYVLAGELHECNGDHVVAFQRYEQRLQPFLASKQKAAERFASSFAPKTALGVVFRDNVTRLMTIPAIADFLMGQAVKDDIALPDYRY